MNCAIGTVGSPIRLLIENASQVGFVLAQLGPGEIAFPFVRDADNPEAHRRLITAADTALALQNPAAA